MPTDQRRMSRERDAVPSCGSGSGLDPDAWFPLRESDLTAEVLTACAGCPVRRRCLAAALTRPEVGIWAGTTTLERRVARAAITRGVPAAVMVEELLDVATTRAAVVGAARAVVEPVAS